MNVHQTLVLADERLAVQLGSYRTTSSDFQGPETIPDLEVRVYPAEAGNLLVVLSGELGGQLVPELDAAFLNAARRGIGSEFANTVTFDMTEVQFIYMRGIAVLQDLFQQLIAGGWHVMLANARPNVADLLALARQHHWLVMIGLDDNCKPTTRPLAASTTEDLWHDAPTTIPGQG